jgi:RND family efflux transporter MFP subunit
MHRLILRTRISYASGIRLFNTTFGRYYFEMRVRAFTRLILSLSATLLAGCGKTGDSPTPRVSAENAKAVRVARAELRPMVRAISVTGTLAAQEKSTLSAKVAGRLQYLQVDIGSVVRQGDLLAQIEPRDYELRLQQASAALAQARATLGLSPDGEDDRVDVEQVSAVKLAKAVFDEAAQNQTRVTGLSESGIASASELDTVQATYHVAQSRYEASREEARTRASAVAERRAEFELSRKQLADTAVRAPFDGAVQSRSGHLGEYVAPGTPILELVKIDPLRLRLQVPERESTLVRTDQVVQLFVEGDTNAYAGRIARLSPALDEQSRMLFVEADVPARGSLRPGLFARSQVIVDERQEGLSVPANALTTFAGLEKVVVVQAGKALEKVVRTGRRGADWVEIISGIARGEGVVLDPGGLRTGQPVSISETPVASGPQDSAYPAIAD